MDPLKGLLIDPLKGLLIDPLKGHLKDLLEGLLIEISLKTLNSPARSPQLTAWGSSHRGGTAKAFSRSSEVFLQLWSSGAYRAFRALGFFLRL